MITLALDEYGDFENLKGVNDAVFIGGILYDDCGNSKDKKEEALRIRAYYERVLQDASKKMNEELKYPHALHDGTGYNSKTIATVKTIVGSTIAEFLKKGTYKGDPLLLFNGNQWKALSDRKGCYAIYCILKSDEGKIERNAENAGFLLKDSYASNLYHHMASDVIQRVIFQNPLADNNSHFFLEIATRSSGSLKRGCPLAVQYKKQKYSSVKKNRDGSEVTLDNGELAEYFQLTNPDIYRTIIEQFVSDNNPRRSVVDDFKVESIQYKQPNMGQEFLFLADSVCSVLSFKLKKTEHDTADLWINEISERAQKLLPKDRLLIFGYDAADVDFGKALDAYQRGDFYEALNIVCDAEKKTKGFYGYYKETWFEYIKEQIRKTEDVPGFIAAVRKVYYSQLSNEYVRHNGMFILDELEKLVPRMKDIIKTPEKKSIFYYLFEAKMIAYCHEGDSANAEAYYMKARAYAHLVSTEEYLRTRNMLVVCCCDSLEPEKALDIATDNIDYAHRLAVVKSEIDDQISREGYLSESKAYSQRGQVFAFLKKEEAEHDFRKALSMMVNKSADYYITESYLLHHFIAMNDKAKYENYAEDYFGTNNLYGQLEYIFKEGFKTDPIINYSYALYVYTKAVFTFYEDEVSDELWKALSDLESFARNIGIPDLLLERKKLKEHPAEMIYKYLCLIAINRQDEEAFAKLRMCYEESVTEKSPLVNAIKTIGKIEIAISRRKVLEAYDNITELCKVLEDNYPCFSNIDYSLNIPDLLNTIKERFTFMYV